MDTNALLAKLHAIDGECRRLQDSMAILQWDQETYLPESGVEERAEQLALLGRIAHERFVCAETAHLLEELGSVTANPGGDEKLPAIERDFLRVTRRDYDREVKLPADFVSEAAKAEGLSTAAWSLAKRNNDFNYFLPHLCTMMELARKRSVYWGYTQNVYDGLLSIYEPGMDAKAVTSVFTPLREQLSVLLKKIASAPQPDRSFLDKKYNTETQALFSAELMKRLGFDLNRGRLDVSAHPFTTSLGCDDVRITTRYFPENLLSGVFSVIHESGHAFYDMAYPAEIRGSCLADGASMGIHESQSRLWENVIGRSRPFWEYFFPVLKNFFPDELRSVTAESFYKAANICGPSLIRVDADEVSYSLHIILRFELEQGLFNGTVKPEDLPKLWRERMKEIVGAEPETDTEGVLQDIHWSMGSFGYFPSYALGNLYGLQFFGSLKKDIPDADAKISAGDFAVIHNWLHENIHKWGRRLDPPDLLKKVTGQNLSVRPFLNYIEEKYSGIYGF
ncbi:MAG: carboxypeptidase M32 [Treponema sp.]|nr:carboxypeptidase M32 [Treponema sp.]